MMTRVRISSCCMHLPKPIDAVLCGIYATNIYAYICMETHYDGMPCNQTDHS